MVVTQTENAFLSEVNPEFAPLIPSINTAFAKLWEKSDTVEEFRARWATTRGSYPDFVPTDGFTISHQMVPTSDGTKIEIRKWTPDGKEASKLPLLFVLHGGGLYKNLYFENHIDSKIGFVLGSHDTENGMSRSICVKNQMIVISVDYRQFASLQLYFRWLTIRLISP
jgi:acetyl esterase/lipase